MQYKLEAVQMEYMVFILLLASNLLLVRIQEFVTQENLFWSGAKT